MIGYVVRGNGRRHWSHLKWMENMFLRAINLAFPKALLMDFSVPSQLMQNIEQNEKPTTKVRLPKRKSSSKAMQLGMTCLYEDTGNVKEILVCNE